MSKNHMVYLPISPRREVLMKHLKQPFTSFHIKPFRTQFNFTVTSLTAIFQSSSCIMNKPGPLYSSFIVNCVVNACSAHTANMLNILKIHGVRKRKCVSERNILFPYLRYWGDTLFRH